MSNITVSSQGFSLAPRTFTEAMEYSKMIAKSDLAPKDFRGKPDNVIVAIQMGSEIGLSPMQALQNISVINGRPCVWGDAALALVQASPEFEDIEETVDDNKATCIVKRKGQKEHVEVFTKEDATQAGLLAKGGVWKQYPKRMMQMRARGFALRNKFADVLMGLNIAEEVRDYIDITPMQEQPYSQPAVIEYADAEQIEHLKELFVEHTVEQENIDKWLSDLSVSSIEEAPKSKVLAAIKKLEEKPTPNPVPTLNDHYEGAAQ